MGEILDKLNAPAEIFERAVADVAPRRAVAVSIREARKAKIKTVESMGMYMEDAVATIADVMANGKDKERLQAAKMIIEYVAGRPSEIKFDNGEGAIHTLSDGEYEDITEDNKKKEKIQKMIEKRYRSED